MHVPSLLDPLQYLPNTIGVKSKFLSMTYKILHTLAPAYFLDFTLYIYPNSFWLLVGFISIPDK